MVSWISRHRARLVGIDDRLSINQNPRLGWKLLYENPERSDDTHFRFSSDGGSKIGELNAVPSSFRVRTRFRKAAPDNNHDNYNWGMAGLMNKDLNIVFYDADGRRFRCGLEHG